MYIDEFITMHPELLPEGEDLMEFSARCEHYIDHCTDLVPYDSPTYVEDVFRLCIACAINNK